MDQAGTSYTSTWPDGVKVTAVVIDDDNVQEMVEFPEGHPARATVFTVGALFCHG